MIFDKNDRENLGSLIVNVVVVASVMTYFLFEMNKETVSKTTEEWSDKSRFEAENPRHVEEEHIR